MQSCLPQPPVRVPDYLQLFGVLGGVFVHHVYQSSCKIITEFFSGKKRLSIRSAIRGKKATQIEHVLPPNQVELCVIHKIWHSLRYTLRKDQRAFMKDLRQVYQAPSLQAAEEGLEELAAKWEQRYPMVIRSLKNKWGYLSTYFQYSPEILRLTHTTIPVETLNRAFRKVTKPRGVFHECSTAENAISGVFGYFQGMEWPYSRPE